MTSQHQIDIHCALEALVASYGEHFVIVKVPSGIFIQFAGSQSEPLLLDIPCSQLTEAQRRIVFDVLGVPPHAEPLLDVPDGEETGDVIVSFMVKPLATPEEAASLGAAVLRRLGVPSDAKLVIEKSWDESHA